MFLGPRAVGALAPGATESGTTTLIVPGVHRCRDLLRARQADWPGQVEETSNANNTRASGAVRIGPDLVVSAVSVPATAAAGETLVVGDTTRNQGAGIRAVDAHAFYLSTNTAWDAADLPLGEREAGPLAPAARHRRPRRRSSFQAPRRPGTYYLLARADAADTLVEVAENNNLRSGVRRVWRRSRWCPPSRRPAHGRGGRHVSMTEIHQERRRRGDARIDD